MDSTEKTSNLHFYLFMHKYCFVKNNENIKPERKGQILKGCWFSYIQLCSWHTHSQYFTHMSEDTIVH